MNERAFPPLDDDERALARRLGAEGDVPPPRRTDSAFALSVQSAVKERKARAPFALVAVALSFAAVLVLSLVPLFGGTSTEGGASADELYAASLEIVEEESDALVALDDESLLALNAVLDQKLVR